MAINANNYEKIARIYDSLKSLILGKNPVINEVYHIKDFNLINHLLVPGCGSSEFLEFLELNKINKITCLDSSKKMCDLSQKRIDTLGIRRKVEVLNSDFLDWQTENKFDLISLPYILDCQKDEDIKKIINKCHNLASQNSYLIISDFSNNGNFLQKYLLGVMYGFFKMFTHIPRNAVPNYNSFIELDKWQFPELYQHPKFGLFSLKIRKKST